MKNKTPMAFLLHKNMSQHQEWVQDMIHLLQMKTRNMDPDACLRNFPHSNCTSQEIIMMIIYLHKFIVMTLIWLFFKVSRAVSVAPAPRAVENNGTMHRSIKRSRILSTMLKKTRRYGSESSIGLVVKTLRNSVKID